MNACGETTPATITGYDCWKLDADGIPHPGGCKVNIAGPTIEIENTGGVGTHIEWMVEGGGETLQCEVVVANPGH